MGVQIITTQDANSIEALAKTLESGGVAVFPTETVYGIGALASEHNSAAVRRIYDIKQRPTSLPLPVLVQSVDWLERFAPQAPQYAHALARSFWPGALTLIVEVDEGVAACADTSADGTIGLRCPNHPFILALLKRLHAPLYATSANSHGMPSPVSFDMLEPRVLDAVDIAVRGGACQDGQASTVVSCLGSQPEILREGSITRTMIESAIKRS